MAKRQRSQSDSDAQGQGQQNDAYEKVVMINRTASVVKGGRRFSFSALVVAGDRKGRVGYGFGKGKEVADAIRKGTEIARRSMVSVTLRGTTLPHAVVGQYGAARVMMRPASPGTGVIAGGGVRAVCEAAGVQDILAKSLGASNALNVVKATVQGLLNLRNSEEIFRARGIQSRPKQQTEPARQN